MSEKLKGDTVDDKIEKKPKSQNDIFHEDGKAKEAKFIIRRSKLPPPRQQTKIKVQFTGTEYYKQSNEHILKIKGVPDAFF